MTREYAPCETFKHIQRVLLTFLAVKRRSSVKVILEKSSAVREWLLRKSQSQGWLAHRLRITTGYMSQLMAEQKHPSPGLRKRMLAQFGGEFDDWFEIKSD